MSVAPRRRTTVTAAVLALLALSLTSLTVALDVVNRAHLGSLSFAGLSSIAVPIGAGLLGLLVASRRPGNGCGWLLLAIAILSSLQGATAQYARFALLTAPGAPGAVWAEWVGAISVPALFPAGAVSLLLMLLPDGHLPSSRWRPLVFAAVAASTALLLLSAFAPGPLSTSTAAANYPDLNNPLGIGILSSLNGGNTAAATLVWCAGLAVLVAAAVTPMARMRRAGAEERQQLKWMAYAVVATVVAVVVMVFLAGSVLPSWSFDVAITAGFGIAFPTSVGIAIFKHRLYDIDVVISRTLVYGSLAAFITAVYVGVAVGVGAALGGGGRPNLGLSIAATALVAVGFQPARERVQRVANRLVYGRRATPYEVLAEFSERVSGSYASDEVMPRMARLLAEGTAARRADVWLRAGDAWRIAATWPPHPEAAAASAVEGDGVPAVAGSRVVEVRHQGEVLGALSVTKRLGESLSPVEQELLADLASQAGLVLKNVGLTSDLEARLLELKASRQRLISAQDSERRRLERNLHDGAQQHLVALKVKLGLLGMLLDRDPDKALTTLHELKGDADEALSTLRDLARGIYPPLLAEKGLVAALTAQARRATTPVTIVGDVGRFGHEVEAGVYFAVLEALQNVHKYAGASAATVSLEHTGGELRFAVRDDGRGFDVASTPRGSGLTNLADRLDALGGTLEVRSAPGAGTEVRGALPAYETVLAADQASSRRSGLNSDLGMKPAAPTSAA